VGRTSGRILLALAALAAIALWSGVASGERSQKDGVVVSLDGGITPRTLPRHDPAPVTVRLAGGVETADGVPLPRVNWIRLELAWRGVLNTRGLAVCPRERLESADSETAMERCGAARVGHGGLFARLFVPNQDPFNVKARITAFNGRTKGGHPAVLVHAYSSRPPVSFIIPFSVHRQPGSFQTVLVALIRRSVGPWPRVSDFNIVVSREFHHRGEERSYLRASCPIPPDWTAGFLSFARATYSFEGGGEITTESVRSCRAR
jgi:hypothetical protein